VFENRVLRRIFGPKRDEVMGEWRKLHNKELRDLYSSPSIIRIIKSRRMRCAGHVARIREKRNAYRLVVNPSSYNWLQARRPKLDSRQGKLFSLYHSFQIGSGIHSVSYPMGNEGCFSCIKAAGE
jgi:hypothetical protein